MMSSGIGFITEAQLEEKRKSRQEEWEKVRKPEEPLEAPAEEPFDGRSLFDRLQEQKNLKQEEFEESRKLKNLVKVLDDDECEFLDYVDQARIDEDKRKRSEEAKELFEFRDAVAKLREKHLESAISQEIALGQSGSSRTKKPSFSDSDSSIGTNKLPQSKLLAGLVIKRKSIPNGGSDDSATTNKKSKQDDNIQDSLPRVESSNIPATSTSPTTNKSILSQLPGLASYGTSSSSDESDQDS